MGRERINVLKLQEELTNNLEAINKILVHLGFDADKLRYKAEKHQILTPRPDGDNPNGYQIFTDTLHYECYTRGKRGDIISLVMDLKKCSFPEALEFICRWTGIQKQRQNITLPFGGFYKAIAKSETEPECVQHIYKPTDIPPEDSGISEHFLKDGISLQVQDEYGIRFDHQGNNILIPIYDLQHNLVGCKGRNNDSNCDFNNRWFAYLPYSKSCILYGLSNNYLEISQKGLVLIAESEKAVMQAASMGIRCVVAIGGHSLSSVQIKYIKSLPVMHIIIAYDNDINEEELIFECNKLKTTNPFLNYKVGYIKDYEQKYLKNKESPFDKGKKVLQGLMKDSVRWI